MADDTTTAAVKRKLNITWSDTNTDARVADVIATVLPAVRYVIGLAPSYSFSSTDGEEWGLFLNGCLYEWSNAFEDFFENYASDIIRCRMRHEAGSGGADDPL